MKKTVEGKSLEVVVNDVIDCYKENAEVGVQVTLQFIANASSSEVKVETLKNLPDIITAMEDEVRKRGGCDFPLIGKGSKPKKNRYNYCQFLSLLVKHCKNSVLYDGNLFRKLCAFLAMLSASRIRGFRYTGTMGGLHLLRALSRVEHSVHKHESQLHYQLGVEKQKKCNDMTLARVDSLDSDLSELQDNLQELNRLIGFLFKGIFVSRVRDVWSEIREMCCEMLGLLMEQFPEMYVLDKYLKYIGFLLYDNAVDVRRKSLQTLLPLYESFNFHSAMTGFTSSFLDRLLYLIFDKDIDISVQAFEVITLIDKQFPGAISDKDKEKLYLLIFSKHSDVSKAAGTFLLQIFDKMGQIDNSDRLENIICFFSESRHPNHARCIVDALWDQCDELRDWAAMSKRALSDEGAANIPFIKIILSCVERATAEEASKGKKPFKVQKLTEENYSVEEIREKLTHEFICSLPDLLRSNLCENEALKLLLTIPLHFKLDMFGTPLYQEKLKDLLNIIKKFFLRLNDSGILDACVNILRMFHSEERATFDMTDVLLNLLAEKCVKHYYISMTQWQQMETEEMPAEVDVNSIVGWIYRLNSLYTCTDMSKYELWQHMFQILADDEAYGKRRLPEQVLCLIMRNCYFDLVWRLMNLAGHLSDTNSVSHLANDVHSYLHTLQKFMADDSRMSVKREAFTALCDFLPTFDKKAATVPVFPILQCLPDLKLQDNLVRYVQQHIFVKGHCLTLTEDSDCKDNLITRRKLLVGYCKLILLRILPVTNVIYLLQHYNMFQEFKDILVYLMEKLQEIDGIVCGRAVVNALIMGFSHLPSPEMNNFNQNFSDLKELGAELCMTLKKNTEKSVLGVVILEDGINYVAENIDKMTPLLFLEVLLEFNKLLTNEHQCIVLRHLNKVLTAPVEKPTSGYWKSYMKYKESLEATLGSKVPEKSPKTKKGKTTSNKKESVGKSEASNVVPKTSKTKAGKRKSKMKLSSLNISVQLEPRPKAGSTPLPSLSATPTIEDMSNATSQLTIN